MRQSYRGHEIAVTRERSLGGDVLLYFSVFRESDGYECVSGFTTGSDSVRDYMRYMRERIDAELAEDDPWMEMTPCAASRLPNLGRRLSQ